MPFFEYKCAKCGKIFEEYVKKYDDEVKCPACGEKAERMHGKLQNVRRMSLKFLKSLEIRLSDDEFQAVSALYFNALATRLRAYFGQASGGLYTDLKIFI